MNRNKPTRIRNVQARARFALLLKAVLCLVVFSTAAFFVLPPILGRIPYRVPLPLAQRAKERVALLRPGMTDKKVWSVLGLSGWGFSARAFGSGPRTAFPVHYQLWPGYALQLRWNYTNKPVTLVEAKFQDG